MDRNFFVSSSASSHVNEGLRSYMVSVFNYMALALGVTGLTAFFICSSPNVFNALYSSSALRILIGFAPLAFVIFFSAKLHSLSAEATKSLFWVFAVLMGMSIAPIFVIYTGTSIARVFFIAASMFGTMAFYGNTTKKDLSSMGSFLVMGVIGLFAASIINIFVGSSALQFAISFIAVGVFTGLTAYDVQRIKDTYYVVNSTDSSTMSKIAIYGALTLYMDFINIFVSLLHILGQQRN